MSQLSCLVPFQTNATCSPSGEKAGKSSVPASVVRGMTRIGGAAPLVDKDRCCATLNQVASDATPASSRAPAVSHRHVRGVFVAVPGLGDRGTGASTAPIGDWSNLTGAIRR